MRIQSQRETFARQIMAAELSFNWKDPFGLDDSMTRGHNATSEVGDLLQTHREFPLGKGSRGRVTDQSPAGWGYGIWTNEPNGTEGRGGAEDPFRDGDLVWQGNNGHTIYPTHDEAKAAAEAHYHSLDHRNRSVADSGVDYSDLNSFKDHL